MTETTDTKDVQTAGYLIKRTARFYDLFGGSRRRARRVLHVFPPKDGESILDVGCGTGELACTIAQLEMKNVRVAGVDPSSQMLEVARRKAQKLGLTIDFRPAAIEKLPFSDKSFNRVYSTLMTHHLPVKVKIDGFREIRRVLRNGGKFHIVDFGPPSSAIIRVLVLPMILMEKFIFSGGDAIESNLTGRIPELLNQAGFTRAEVLAKDFHILEYIQAE